MAGTHATVAAYFNREALEQLSKKWDFLTPGAGHTYNFLQDGDDEANPSWIGSEGSFVYILEDKRDGYVWRSIPCQALNAC